MTQQTYSMNFLLNLYVSKECTNDIIFGSFTGEFVSPALCSQYSNEMLKGIQLIEDVKRFAITIPAFKRSCKRLNYRFSKHSNEIIFLFYDHFLAQDWNKYNSIGLEQFIENKFELIFDYKMLLPYKLKLLLPYISKNKSLTNFNTIAGIHDFMKIITKRSNFNGNLQNSIVDLTSYNQLFQEDFNEFIYELLLFVSEWKTKHMNYYYQETSTSKMNLAVEYKS